jgi:hypothetical protein
VFVVVKPLVMKLGEKLWLNRPVTHWRMLSEDSPAVVVMIASVQAEPANPSLRGSEPDSTAFAVEMTPQVAMQLYDQLGELGRRNGWLAQKEISPA